MSDWPVGLSTGCFYNRPILECLPHIRDAGFGLIEVCSFPAHLDYHDRREVARTARELEAMGLEPYSMHAPFADEIDITAPDPAVREHGRREIHRAAEAAATLRARHFVIHPGPEKEGLPENQRLDRMENAVEVLDDVAQRCRQLGVGLVLENMLPHLFTGHVRDLLWILGALAWPRVGICLDTGHAKLSGDLATVVEKLSGHLWMVHASDNRGRGDDHLPPGDGHVDWKRLVGQLRSTGFGGALILEIAGGDDSERILENARRGRRHLADVVRRVAAPRQDGGDG